MDITKICLTGGACGGKSSSLSLIKEKLEERGYNVIIVPEVATKIIGSGIIPGRTIPVIDFQNMVLENQLFDEKMYADAAEKMFAEGKKTVLIMDRGVGDQYAFLDKKDMDQLLANHGLTKNEALSTYDCVIHLKTAADGALEYYQWNDPDSNEVGNNASRLTPPEEAIKQDKVTLQSWMGHPHFRVIDNSTDFNGKVARAVKEVFAVLGEPIPCEIERKFLVKMPTEEQLKSLEFHNGLSKAHITQTYLKSDSDIERRVRKRGDDIDGYVYRYTEKSPVSAGKRKEVERMIDVKEYETYLTFDKDERLATIEKDRYCFLYKNQYFEMDIYPFDKNYAILEIELNDLEQKIELPPELEIVREVTNDPNYSNHSIASSITSGEYVLEEPENDITRE